VEARGEVRAAVDEKDPDGLVGPDGHRPVPVPGDGVFLTVDVDISRILTLHRGHIETQLVAVALGVDLVLAEVDLLVDRRQPFRGLHNDDAEHAGADVHIEVRHRTVVDIRARIGRLELEPGRLAGARHRGFGAADPAPNGVEVHVVGHDVRTRVLEGEVDRITLSDADQWSRHLAVVRHVVEGHAVGHLDRDFLRPERDLDRLRLVALDGLRDVSRVRRDPIDRLGGGGFDLAVGRHRRFLGG
jgi:hypothetical protein